MKQRKLDSFNTSITNTFATLRISTRQKLVGSSSVVGSIITNDYDLNELVQHNGDTSKILTHIYKTFKEKFKTIYETNDTWIIDFKCGTKFGEPLRWNRAEINAGVNNNVRFLDCILQKAVCKIDIVSYLNGRFVEISEIYYFNINGVTNYNENEFELPYIIHELEQDRIELLADGNQFKALKREYSILLKTNKGKRRQKELLKIFNGSIGWLYYCISSLRTLIEMKNQTFRPVPLEVFKIAQQVIKDDISRVVSYPFAVNILNKSADIDDLEKIITKLTNSLNEKL